MCCQHFIKQNWQSFLICRLNLTCRNFGTYFIPGPIQSNIHKLLYLFLMLLHELSYFNFSQNITPSNVFHSKLIQTYSFTLRQKLFSPLLQLGKNFTRQYILLCHQHQQVVKKIRGFSHQLLLIPVFSTKYYLCSLFADLF